MVSHKKCASLFLTTTLVFLEWLLCFCTSRNRNEYPTAHLLILLTGITMSYLCHIAHH